MKKRLIMIDNKTFSVIITTYRRYDTLGQVIQGWLDNNPDQLWVIDNKSGYKLEERHKGKVVLFSMPIDLTTRVDYAFAMLTEGDFVVLADDDAVVAPGFLEDMYNGWKKVGGGIVGVIGRQFTSDRYIKCKHFRAEKIIEPARTGSIGIIYITPREYLGFDTRGMETIDDDLFWLMNKHPEVPKHIIPTKKYRNLLTGNDADCLFHASQSERKIRNGCYQKYYFENYKPFNKLY